MQLPLSRALDQQIKLLTILAPLVWHCHLISSGFNKICQTTVSIFGLVVNSTASLLAVGVARARLLAAALVCDDGVIALSFINLRVVDDRIVTAPCLES